MMATDKEKTKAKKAKEAEMPKPGKQIPLNKKRAEAFAEEYVKDFIPWVTLMRLRWVRNEQDARDEALRFMNYPPVYEAVANLVYGSDGIIPERILIMNKLWEEANTAKESSTRVNALKTLGGYLGMNEKPIVDDDGNEETNLSHVPISDKEAADFKKKFAQQYVGK